MSIRACVSLPQENTTTWADRYPLARSAIPDIEICEGKYRLRFARTAAELDAVLKLRFEVFNIELEEGLDSSFKTGRDRDEFDSVCHHLLVLDDTRGEIIGTYRVQTAEMAASSGGFYSAGEFDLSRLPAGVLEESVELGRACIAREHRSTVVLFLLWRGLAAYMLHNRKRYLFGCCSLTSQDAREGLAVMKLLGEQGHLHPLFHVAPRDGFECSAAGPVPYHYPASIPKLFRTYLRFGAKVCGPPAIDRMFKTIDYLVLFDLNDLAEQSRRLFFGG
jgi:putative hemolysin